MVIGNGLLAKAFESYQANDQFMVFAAGVSNSRNVNSKAFQRESDTLKQLLHDHHEKTAVYFSTYSVYDPEQRNSVYVQHKLAMEQLVQSNVNRYFIVRAPNVVGRSNNPHTVLNFFFHHIKNRISFDLWVNACRNLLDVEDLFFICDRLFCSEKAFADPVNVCAPVDFKVKEIVETIESFLGVKANYGEVQKGSCFQVDLSDIQDILDESRGQFNRGYLSMLLSKYYQKFEPH